jgi:hypothetical protein
LMTAPTTRELFFYLGPLMSFSHFSCFKTS